MRLQHVLRVVETEPWLIKPAAHLVIHRIVMSHVTGDAHKVGGISDLFEPQERPKMEIDGEDVAVIPVKGVIGQGVSGIERSSGVTDTNDIAAMLDEAAAHPDVTAVLLDVDSPGGTVAGVPELADKVRGFEKPIFAYTSGQMDSAAYWIGSAADAIYATRSATVGSVGVYMALLDSSRRYALEGYDVDVIKNGIYKAAGLQGTSLTPEQRAEFQEQVDYLGATFKSSVLARRPNVPADAMEGQEFYGEQAINVGMVDAVTDYYTALRDVSVLGKRQRKMKETT